MKYQLLVLVMAFSVTFMADAFAQDRAAKQAELDAACEAARQTKLVQVRAELIEECVETKQLRDRPTCERFYADYGESSANQAPLFYDLPECEEAHRYRRSYRSSGN
jgi:hypothetical protein